MEPRTYEKPLKSGNDKENLALPTRAVFTYRPLRVKSRLKAGMTNKAK
jgi:hypothetical protein